jgi:rhodanese-related sulfurtransferase
MGLLSNLFGKKSKTDYNSLLQDNGIIVDVRSPQEYSGGNIKGSINIPLQQIGNKSEQLKKYKNVIVCCQSGMRSASAASILKGKGFENVYNGGGWSKLISELGN